MKLSLRPIWLTLLVSTLATTSLIGCSQSGQSTAPTCENVAAHVIELMKPELEKQLAAVQEESARQHIRESMEKSFNLETLTEQCKQQGASPEALSCSLKAKDLEAVARCQLGAKHQGQAMPKPGQKSQAAAGDKSAGDKSPGDKSPGDKSPGDKSPAGDTASGDETDKPTSGAQ